MYNLTLKPRSHVLIVAAFLLLAVNCVERCLADDIAEVKIDGPFRPNVASLSKYACPEWFRDAKFGIYVHWGIYSVPERGEWYGREMYQEGSSVYKHHVETWGHPSKFGYHDFIPMWKAEKFDPDAWLTLFKEAGAKYFTPCAVHHDGFALWKSKYTPFNAAEMGPKKDLLGMMRDATLRHGLRWGVTTHYDRSINWMQPCHGADKVGEFKGVPYIKNDPKLADLYLLPFYDDNRADTEEAPTWWKELWLLKQKELIDNYQPDFVYLDSAVPFAGSDRGRTGMRLFAYFYNTNMARHHGKLEAVMTHKGDKGPKRAPYFPDIATLDIERGKSGQIRPQPWQTDDSIGPWGFNPEVRYKDPNAVIDKMIDIVSKNGNLLLNVPPHADGSLDDETVAILKGVGKWLKLNGEGIYATRPWKVFGEGPDVRMGDRDDRSPYGAANIRFTQSKDGSKLYAIQMGWPGGSEELRLTSFAEDGPGADLKVSGVSLLGSDDTIDWSREANGLRITSPAAAPSDLAVVYKIDLGEAANSPQ
jgi:alpha-L-fucosidase